MCRCFVSFPLPRIFFSSFLRVFDTRSMFFVSQKKSRGVTHDDLRLASPARCPRDAGTLGVRERRGALRDQRPIPLPSPRGTTAAYGNTTRHHVTRLRRTEHDSAPATRLRRGVTLRGTIPWDSPVGAHRPGVCRGGDGGRVLRRRARRQRDAQPHAHDRYASCETCCGMFFLAVRSSMTKSG